MINFNEQLNISIINIIKDVSTLNNISNDILIKYVFSHGIKTPLIKKESKYNLNLLDSEIYDLILNNIGCSSTFFINNKEILCKIDVGKDEFNKQYYYLFVLIVSKNNSKL